MNNALTIKQYLDSDLVKDRIYKVLQGKAQNFIVSLLSTVNGSVELSKCSPASIYNAAMTAASLDLPINQNLGFAYIIPYKGVAQFQMGVKGFKQLAIRSGMYLTINDTDVKEGELKSIDRLTGQINCEWYQGADRDTKKTVGYLAYFKLHNGYEKYRYMSIADLQKHGLKYSQTYKRGFGLWKDDFDAMAKKTVVKLLLSKDGVLSSAMQEAIEKDQAVMDGDKTDYVDNKKQNPQDISEEKERQRLIKYIKTAKTVEALQKCKTSCVDEELVELYNEREKKLTEKKKEDEPVNTPVDITPPPDIQKESEKYTDEKVTLPVDQQK